MTGIPVWKRGMTLAHAVYALLEESGLGKTAEAVHIRRCALTVPSAIEDAFGDHDSQDPGQALDRAETCLATLRSALYAGLDARHLPREDVDVLISEIETLRVEIGSLRNRRRLDLQASA